jgi:hypothetical protein
MKDKHWSKNNRGIQFVSLAAVRRDYGPCLIGDYAIYYGSRASLLSYHREDGPIDLHYRFDLSDTTGISYKHYYALVYKLLRAYGRETLE